MPFNMPPRGSVMTGISSYMQSKRMAIHWPSPVQNSTKIGKSLWLQSSKIPMHCNTSQKAFGMTGRSSMLHIGNALGHSGVVWHHQSTEAQEAQTSNPKKE